MKHVMKHDLPMDLARRAAVKASETYAERFADYQPTTTWKSENEAEVTFSAKGVKLAGSLELVPGAIEMDLEVPFLFRPFKKRAMGIVEGAVMEWLEKAKRGELDAVE